MLQIMNSVCGANCDNCGFNKDCAGCAKSGSRPFGKECTGAEYIKSGGMDYFESFKNTLIEEFNSLGQF